MAGLLAGVAGAGLRATPGVTSASILIGGTAALSSESARGAEAYFRYINARGGLFGRSIVYRYLDDGGDPARTVIVVRRLVERERVFAIFNTPGTGSNLAVRDYLNARKVPHLFVASGFTGWGRDARRYPWTVGFQPAHATEGTVYGRYLTSTRPGVRVAVLYENDEDGLDLLNGLKRGLRGSGTVHAVSGGRVETNVARLRQTRSSVLAIFGSGEFAVQALRSAARAGWRPQIFLTAAAADARGKPRGAISAAFVKDPADPAWRGDPGLELYQQVMRAAGLGSPTGIRYMIGAAAAFTLVRTLEKAGSTPTRGEALKATANLNEADNPFLLPGILVRALPRDRFPIEQVQLRRWNGMRWVRFGGLVTAKS